MKKKVRELTYDDLGKHVIVSEANGDRNSGELKSISYATAYTTGTLSVDNANIFADIDSEVEFTD